MKTAKELLISLIDEMIDKLKIENRDSSELSTYNIYEWTACIGMLTELKEKLKENKNEIQT